MKGLLTIDDAAMLPIAHQVGTFKLAIATPRGELVLNTRALARIEGEPDWLRDPEDPL